MSFSDNLARNLWPSTAWKNIARLVWGEREKVGVNTVQIQPIKSTSVATMFNLSPTAIFLTRLAGISGALAVALGAYGSHVIKNKDLPEDRKIAYDTANRYHMLHTLALLAMPLTRRPALSGALIGAGMILFCGACYSYGITGNTYVTQFAPYGGMLLIIGWISMVF